MFEDQHFGAKLPISLKGRITVCLVGEPQQLLERGFSTMFSS
jgi:hypothetical protein